MTYKQFLKETGLDKASLKRYFTQSEHKNDKLRKLLDLVQERVDNGIDEAIRRSHIYYAIDKAYDSPLNQIPPTLLRDIGSSQYDDKKVFDMLKEWSMDLDYICCDEVGPDGKVVMENGKPKKKLNIPAMFQVLPAIVKAYVTIRRARIFNERNLVPLFKYEPLKFTADNRLRCEIITDRVQRMATEFGYSDILKQSILQTLNYGVMLQFPVEAWYRQRGFDGLSTDALLKEGIRYHLPHPTRMFWDGNHRLSTLHTDTGCEYAGYWGIRRFSDISDAGYWNLGSIAIGSNDFFTNNETYFKYVYPCAIKFPDHSESRQGVADNDRETRVEHYDTGNDGDSAVINAHIFLKIKPSDWGISKYKNPVWLRLELANNRTVIMAEAHPSCPVLYSGYDTDENRDVQSSLALEVMPFADQIANHLTQFIISVRQNLTRATFYDPNAVSTAELAQIRNLGFKYASTTTFIPFDSQKMRFMENSQMQSAFQNVTFPQHNTIEIINAIRTLLDILERVLVMSAQEVAQTAAHEQTAEEVRNIAGATSQRLTFTASFIDDYEYAWKRQAYEYLMAFGEDNFYTQVSTSPPVTKDQLKRLGLRTVDEEPDESTTMQKQTVKVTDKAKLKLEGFSSTRDGSNRIDNAAIANAMIQLFGNIAANPMVLQSPQLTSLANQIFQVAGLPREFRLTATEGEGEGIPKPVEEAMVTMANQVGERFKQQEQAVAQSLQQTLTPLVQQVQQFGQAIQQIASGLAENNQLDAAQQQQMQQVQQAVGMALQAIMQQQRQVPMGMPPGMPPIGMM